MRLGRTAAAVRAAHPAPSRTAARRATTDASRVETATGTDAAFAG